MDVLSSVAGYTVPSILPGPCPKSHAEGPFRASITESAPGHFAVCRSARLSRRKSLTGEGRFIHLVAVVGMPWWQSLRTRAARAANLAFVPGIASVRSSPPPEPAGSKSRSLDRLNTDLGATRLLP